MPSFSTQLATVQQQAMTLTKLHITRHRSRMKASKCYLSFQWRYFISTGKNWLCFACWLRWAP